MADEGSYHSLSENSTFRDTLRSVFYFDTIKLVSIHSARYGIIQRLIQLLVLAYIIVYTVWYKEGYQEYTNGGGFLYSKAKGSAIVNSTTATTLSNVVVFDTVDFIQPAVENNALFVVTAFARTSQSRSICQSSKDCNSDFDCPRNYTPDGLILPTCNFTKKGNNTTGKCLLSGWCPPEPSNIKPYLSTLIGLENVTIFFRSTINYKLFNILLTDPTNPITNRNLWPLKDMLVGGSTMQQCVQSGCLIQVQIDWSCNLNKGPENCVPKTTFLSSAGGFNYRKVRYNDTSNRLLEKFYGIRFLVSVFGRAGRFSFFRCIITIGSGVSFFAIATLVVDNIIFLIYRSNNYYLSKKYATFEKVDDKL